MITIQEIVISSGRTTGGRGAYRGVGCIPCLAHAKPLSHKILDKPKCPYCSCSECNEERSQRIAEILRDAAANGCDFAQHSSSKTENKVIEWLHGKGHKVLSKGWPDFLCVTKGGFVFAIEVKSATDRLRPEQKAVLQILSELGIETFLISPSEAAKGCRFPGHSVRPLYSTYDRIVKRERPGFEAIRSMISMLKGVANQRAYRERLCRDG